VRDRPRILTRNSVPPDVRVLERVRAIAIKPRRIVAEAARDAVQASCGWNRTSAHHLAPIQHLGAARRQWSPLRNS